MRDLTKLLKFYLVHNILLNEILKKEKALVSIKIVRYLKSANTLSDNSKYSLYKPPVKPKEEKKSNFLCISETVLFNDFKCLQANNMK